MGPPSAIEQARISDQQSEQRAPGPSADADAVAHRLAGDLAEALASGSVAVAEGVVQRALDGGVPATKVLGRVVAPAMYEIGRRWECEELNVADEHLATTLCYQLLAVLYEHLLVARPRSRARLLLACLDGDLHCVGLRMVADVLEGAGFDVLYLGASVPSDALVEAVSRHRPALVGLSATDAEIGAGAAAVVARVRAVDPGVGILLGGQGLRGASQVPEGAMLHDDLATLVQTVERLAGERAALEAGAPDAPAIAGGASMSSGREARFEAAVADMADMTRRLAAEAYRARLESSELQQTSRTDALTGLANRRGIDERVAAAFAAAEAGVMTPGLVLLDVDRFKEINDVHGHLAGDVVLREIARRIDACIDADAAVARWGGEEFAILVADVADEAVLAALAARVLRGIRATAIEAEGAALAVTASAGVARRDEGEAPAALARRADIALYAAKRRGRDRVVAHGDVRGVDDAADESPAFRIARGLALAASVREGMSRLHCDQVADLAARIARELGLGEGRVARCRLGGLLHDVGKLAMPDRLLAKAGALDADEWQLMCQHAEIGAQIIGSVGGLDDAVEAVRHHHERFDGSGYPAGLAGDGIPLEARIVAVADAFCAITSDRAYARGLDVEAALQTMRASAGTQLDPTVVAALDAAIARVAEAPRRAT